MKEEFLKEEEIESNFGQLDLNEEVEDRLRQVADLTLVDISTYLSLTDLYSLYRCSQYYQGFFQTTLDTKKSYLNSFLKHVVRGEHKEVKLMLEKDFKLPVYKAQVTDYSKRTFLNISGFEYVLWALDEQMWNLMLEYIPNTEEGSNLSKILLKQYLKLSKDGVSYQFAGEEITEKHFDYQKTIIAALEKNDKRESAPYKDWNFIEKKWRTEVGSAQSLLPTTFVDEYCCDRPFLHIGEINTKPNFSRQFFNNVTNEFENWFTEDSVNAKLGTDLAIYKGSSTCATGAPGSGGHAAIDLKYIISWCNKITTNFTALKERLENDTVLEKSQIIPM